MLLLSMIPDRYSLPRPPVQLTTSLLLLCVICDFPFAEIPVSTNEPSGRFLREWLVCGPFPNPPADNQDRDAHHPAFLLDQLESTGGESNLEIQEGLAAAFSDTTATWIRYRAERDEIGLDDAVGSGDGILAYAFCEVDSATTQPCLLTIGSNDGCRVRLNGEIVWDRPSGRPALADEDIVPVLLQQGRNRLLLKIENRGKRWSFFCRLLPLTTDRTTADLFQLFRLDYDKNSLPVLRTSNPEFFRNCLARKVQLTVTRSGAPGAIVWEDELPESGTVTIPLDSTYYAEYLLNISAWLLGGNVYEDQIKFSVGTPVNYILFSDGGTAYEIVIADRASESEWWAAQELQHWLAEIGGCSFPIRTTSNRRRAKHRILIGYNPESSILLGEFHQKPEDSDESFTYRNIGPDVVIWGGRQRGSMYGIFSFLEREFHCRWYAPDATSVPRRNSYAFSYLSHSESPAIRLRDMDYFEASDPAWMARNRINSDAASGTAVVLNEDGNPGVAATLLRQIGGLDSYWGVHTLGKLMPHWEFYAAHLEYFSLINGKRLYIPNDSQLCMTNPDVLQIVTARILDVIREQPQHLMYCVSQNDGDNPCQCDECRAMVREYGGESGLVLWFVNQVADSVGREFPDKYISTLAYHYTQSPPKNIRPRDNVVIRLCNFHGCFSHPLTEECERNASFVLDVEGWSKIAPHLFIWDYVVSFSHYPLPFPNLKTIPEHIRFYRDHNALGYYPQAVSTTRGGEFAKLRAYLLAKWMWNPDLDFDLLLDDFLVGYYRSAAPYIRDYIELLHSRITPSLHVTEYLKPEQAPFTDRFLLKAESIFDEAERAADDDVILHRVQAARFPVMYLKCYRIPSLAKKDGTFERVWKMIQTTPITRLSDLPEYDLEAFHKMMEQAN